MRTSLRIAFLLTLSTFNAKALADNWSQFRGPNASGVAGKDSSLPRDLSLDQHLLWEVPLAKGHSSPVVNDGRLFVTTLEDKQLKTVALESATGKRIWEAVAPHKKLESIHGIGSHATSSIATDGRYVISFFGSCGLFCYDIEGNQKWHLPMGPFNNQFGATSSPIIADGRVVLVEDHDTGSFLATYDLETGMQLWRTERANFRRNYCSPVIWNVDGHKQIVVSGTAHVMGYDLESGELVWMVRGLCRVISNTPVVGDDGNLYVASDGGGKTSPQPSFKQLLSTADENGSGALEANELPRSSIKSFFGQFDRDANGSLDETEYESIREIFGMSRTVALSIRPGGKGDITESHVRWTSTKQIPRNSSPVHFKGHLFLVKDGGILTCLNAKTGEETKRGRLADTGKYFSSPIVVGGKLLVCSDRGHVSLASAEPEWELLSDFRLPADIYATPAFAEGRLYIRTIERLYCFGARD
jgi:outer membrane protein assembly factor BamB